MSLFCFLHISVCFRIADEYERRSNEALKDPNHYLANPVNAYLLVKTLTTNWEKVKDIVYSTTNLNGKSIYHFGDAQNS